MYLGALLFTLILFLSDMSRLGVIFAPYFFLTVPSGVRFAHTDIKVPDFSYYRKASVKNSAIHSSESANERRAFTYMMTAGTFIRLIDCLIDWLDIWS